MKKSAKTIAIAATFALTATLTGCPGQDVQCVYGPPPETDESSIVSADSVGDEETEEIETEEGVDEESSSDNSEE